MNRPVLLAVALAVSLLMPCVGFCSDPSDQFLAAFMRFQDGERLERTESTKEALEKYQEAREILQQILKTSPDWQPLVVEYRLKKIRESIDRLESVKNSSPASSFDSLEGDLPEAESLFSKVPSRIPDYAPARPPAPSIPASPRASTPSRADRLAVEGELQALRRQVRELQRSNYELEERLLQKSAQIQSALVEVDKTKVTVVELRSQLKQTTSELEDVRGEREMLVAERQQWNRRMQELENRYAEADADREVLSEENERLLAKLQQASRYIAASDSIREGLLAERQTLAAAVDEAQKALEAKEADILAAAAAKQTEKEQPAEDKADEQALLAENELLKRIIFRQINDQSKRDEALASLEKELADRNITAEAITRQIGVLGAPILQLQEDERSLFEKPMALLSEPEPDALDVTMAISKPAVSGKKSGSAALPAENDQSRAN